MNCCVADNDVEIALFVDTAFVYVRVNETAKHAELLCVVSSVRILLDILYLSGYALVHEMTASSGAPQRQP